MPIATVKIPHTINGMDCQTNGVHPIVLVNAFRMLEKHFADVLVKMAREAVGNDPNQQAQWLDRLTKKHLGENPADLGIDPNNFN